MTAARRILMTTLVMAVMLVPATARAAQYTVHACGAAAHFDNHTFIGAVSDARMAARTLCASDADGHTMGIGVLAGVSQGIVPIFSYATQTFLAPAGTTISHVRLRGEGKTSNGDWEALLQESSDGFANNSRNLAGCSPRPGNASACTAASADSDQNYDLAGATAFRSIVACWKAAGCGTFVAPPWPYSRAYYLMHHVDVTLEDPLAPGVSITGGGLIEPVWQRGFQRIDYDA